MLGNDKWLPIINKLLRGGDSERREARAIMWLEVADYVVRCAKMPIGPPGDDEDERRDIAVAVLRTLEKKDYAHVREWEARQLQGRNAAPWWGFVKMVACCRGIERARG